MSFSGRFNESVSEEKVVPMKREICEEHNSKQQSANVAKKIRSSYGEENHTGKTTESRSENQENYNSENFLANGAGCKSNPSGMLDRNNASKMEAILRKLGNDAKMSLLKWLQPFSESEAFEAYCPARLDDILKQALELEQNLLEQKECLKARMKAVSRTLQAT